MIRAASREAKLRTQAYAIEIDGGARLPARHDYHASGAEYRTLHLQNLSSFEGRASTMRDVYRGAVVRSEGSNVVGAATQRSSRGFLVTDRPKHVHVLIRSGALA